jgi:hypothetical protein
MAIERIGVTQPLDVRFAEINMEAEGPATTLKPGLEKAVLPSKNSFPVKGELRLNGSAEAARAGRNALEVFGQVQNQVDHRPPANGVRQGS